jgi:hypothetical protein
MWRPMNGSFISRQAARPSKYKQRGLLYSGADRTGGRKAVRRLPGSVVRTLSDATVPSRLKYFVRKAEGVNYFIYK